MQPDVHTPHLAVAILVPTLLVASGCATQVEERHRVRIRQRAPADTDCPEGKLRIKTLKIDASSYRGLYRVKACGMKTQYVCTPNTCVPKGGSSESSDEN